LGEVLAGEVELLAALAPLQGGPGVLERAVPALHRLFAADPSADADPLASAWAFLRRGLVALALPAALGRRARAVRDLERALAVILGAPGRLHPAARARIEGNARLALGAALESAGRVAEAREQFSRARGIDPAGPIGQAAGRGIEIEPPDMLAESGGPR
jgi:tetratricopeptide (TPR) repeat protein